MAFVLCYDHGDSQRHRLRAQLALHMHLAIPAPRTLQRMSRPLRVARSSKFVRSRHIMITQGMRRYSSSLSHGDSRAFAQTESAPTFPSISHHSPGPEALSHAQSVKPRQGEADFGACMGKIKPMGACKAQSPPDHGQTNYVRTVRSP